MTSLRAPGRPRDASIDDAILLATWERLNDVGYTALTMTGVAEGAGIQKPALYRRWPTKPLLVVDALARHLPPLVYADQGSLRDDLAHLLQQLAQTWGTAAARRSFNPLLADIETDEVAKAAFRARVRAPRNAALAAALTRAVERGELPDDAHAGLAELLEGPLMHRAMLGGREPDDQLLQGVLTSCLAMLQPSSP